MKLRSTLSVMAAGCLLWAACSFSQEASAPLGDVMRQPKAAKKAKITLTDDDLAASKPKPKPAANVQAAAATDAETNKNEAEAKVTPADSTDTTPPPAEQMEEPSGPQTPAQREARKDVKEALDQVNYLNHNMAVVQSKIDGEQDESRKQSLKDMQSNYKQQMYEAKQQLERAQRELQRANQAAGRE
jgi:hypothetical protein